jgi:hypothetical protein
MFLRSRKPYLTCMAALCASASFTAVLLFAGIAAACSGTGPPGCAGPPSVTTTPHGSLTPTTAYIYGDVEPNNCTTTYEFKYRKSGGSWEGNGPHSVTGSYQSAPDFLSSLSPNTTYEYELTASNIEGTAPSGGIETFKTPEEVVPPPAKPTVANEAATGVTTTGATLNGSVNPNGHATTYKFQFGTKEAELNKETAPISAGSGSTSLKVHAEVGLEPGTKYYFRIWASNEGGTSTGSPTLNFTTSSGLWKIKESLNPGTSDNYLNDVSCEPSTSVCTSVGTSVSSGVESPLALRWNGLAWSEQAAAKKSGTLPTRLLGVDCPSETRCLAAGSYQPSEGGTTLLTEIWNEGKWAVQTTPVPSESTSSELVAIGCNNTAECMAAGSAMIGGVKKAVIEEWNSPTWTLSTVPLPEGAKSSQLDGVDCLFSNLCVAVGRYTTSGGSIKSLVEFWNGTAWSIQTVTDPEGAAQSTLLDVACSTPANRCTAVGGWKNSLSNQFTLAYRFNGSTTWTLQSTPNPSGSIASVFQEVSCPTETSCTADGSWVSGGGGSNQTLAEVWNGTSWSIQGTPNPSGAVFSAFFGLSCRSTTCMGVGWSRNSLEVDSTMSVFRE